MSQRTTGLRSVLSLPFVYRTYHHIVGDSKMRKAVIDELGPQPGERLLDIGCGPGMVLEYLPDVEYVGFDVSSKYIDDARARWGDRGKFFVADVADIDVGALGKFDRVLAHGVLHHIDDTAARQVIELAAAVLTPEGRFVANDSAFAPDQTRISRIVVKLDRGKAIRTAETYRALAEPSFANVDAQVHHDFLRIPYTCVLLSCTDPRHEASAQ